jgi:hypothetical protein
LDPKRVETIPLSTTRIIQLTTAMYIIPKESPFTSRGVSIFAVNAGILSPLKGLDVPLPANVVIILFVSTNRIRLFELSAINRFPFVFTKTPRGKFNLADEA